MITKIHLYQVVVNATVCTTWKTKILKSKQLNVTFSISIIVYAPICKFENLDRTAEGSSTLKSSTLEIYFLSLTTHLDHLCVAYQPINYLD